MGKTEAIIGAFLMILSVTFYALTYQFPEQTLAFSPRIFPRFVSVCLFILAVIMGFQALRGMQKRPAQRQATAQSEKALRRSFLLRMLCCLALGYAYTELITSLGYIVATIPFIMCIMLLFGERRLLVILAGSAVTTGLLYVLFRIVFRVPLPRFDLF